MGILRLVFSTLVAFTAVSVGLASAGAAVAAHGGRVSTRLDILTHFAPFWLLGGLLTLGLAVLTPRGGPRGLVLTLGAVAVLTAAGLIAPELTRRMSPSVAPDAPRQLKLIQFNVWGRNQDVEGTARWIVDQNPDVVVIEEASPAIREALLRRRKYHVACGRCSVMIFSRMRPVSSELQQGQRRGPRPPIARATFGPKDGGFTVVGVHYTWPTRGGYQQAQGRYLAHILDRFPKDRLILTGDFNSTPWSFSRQAEDRRFGLERRTRALFSWPAQAISRFRVRFPLPFLPIDHIYAGRDWRTVSVTRGPRLGSDHFPVIAILSLQPR